MSEAKNDSLQRLVRRWRSRSAYYARRVKQVRKGANPEDALLWRGWELAMGECADELRDELKANAEGESFGMSEANGEYPPLSCSPCPFCGNVDLGIGRGTEDREGYPTYVYCAECGAQGPWIYTRDKGIWACTALACEQTGWNKRPNKGNKGKGKE
jgi:hypothetical protein